MIITKEVVKSVKVTDDILCDVCGVSCKDSPSVESDNIDINSHYAIIATMPSEYFIHLCMKCFNKTLAALRGWQRQSGFKPKGDPFSPSKT